MKSQIMPTITLSNQIPEVQQLMDESELHSAQAQELFERALSEQGADKYSTHLFLRTIVEQNAYLACVAKADLIMQGLVAEAMLGMAAEAEDRKRLA